jgi:hypothetical protein
MAAPVSLTSDKPYMLPLPQLDLEFRKLEVAEIVLEKTSIQSSHVGIAVNRLSLDIGSAKLLGTPALEGELRAPFMASGSLDCSFTKDAQIEVHDYELHDVRAQLDVAGFDDGAGLKLKNTKISLAAISLTATQLEGSLSVNGGQVTFEGPVGGTADIATLNLQVSGKRDQLDGYGIVAISKLSVHGTVRTAPIDRCPGSNLDIDVSGAEALDLTGNVQLVKGKANGMIDVARFKAVAGLSYYRCEWDQKVGHLNPIETTLRLPCPTWSEPFRMCDKRIVLWGGGDVFVHWVTTAQPTLTNVGINIEGLKYKVEEAKACGGTIKGLTVGLYNVAVTPNLPDAGNPIFNVFRDTIQIFQSGWQSAIVDTLGPTLGELGVMPGPKC